MFANKTTLMLQSLCLTLAGTPAISACFYVKGASRKSTSGLKWGHVSIFHTPYRRSHFFCLESQVQ